MKILLDEDSQSKILVKSLNIAGHNVLTVAELGANGRSDQEILKLAVEYESVLLTRNCVDFAKLQNLIPHLGILAIYQNPNPNKNMNYEQIVIAIENLEKSNVVIVGKFINLNQYHWGNTPSPP